MRLALVRRAFFCLTFAAIYARAQFDSATVLGTVKDPSGLAVKGAQIRLTNVSTGIAQAASTDDLGNYQFLTVRAGAARETQFALRLAF